MAIATVTKRRQQTILVVEGRPDVNRLLSRILSADPARILGASSGARALEIARRTRLDLVILDVELPDLDGTEVLRRLRSVDKEVPVIIVTSHGSAITVRAAMELGASDYLTKPFNHGEMKDTIQEALGSRGAQLLGRGSPRAF